MFNLCWSAGLVNGLKPYLPPLSTQKMKCSFLDYGQFLIICWAGRWTQTPSATSLQLKMKCLFLDYVQLLIIGWAGQWTQTHLPPLSSKKNEMLVFGLCSTSDDWPGWSMDSNPICYPSPTKKMICSFLDYVQLLMIGQAGQWTRTPSATPLQPKKWNAHFWITFNFWWSARLAERLQLHLQPLSNQKMKCLFLYYVIVQMISRVGRWTQNPSTTPQAKKMKC